MFLALFLLPLSVEAAGFTNDTGGMNWTVIDYGGSITNDTSGNWTAFGGFGGGVVNDSGGNNWTIYGASVGGVQNPFTPNNDIVSSSTQGGGGGGIIGEPPKKPLTIAGLNITTPDELQTLEDKIKDAAITTAKSLGITSFKEAAIWLGVTLAIIGFGYVVANSRRNETYGRGG